MVKEDGEKKPAVVSTPISKTVKMLLKPRDTKTIEIYPIKEESKEDIEAEDTPEYWLNTKPYYFEVNK